MAQGDGGAMTAADPRSSNYLFETSKAPVFEGAGSGQQDAFELSGLRSWEDTALRRFGAGRRLVARS